MIRIEGSALRCKETAPCGWQISPSASPDVRRGSLPRSRRAAAASHNQSPDYDCLMQADTRAAATRSLASPGSPIAGTGKVSVSFSRRRKQRISWGPGRPGSRPRLRPNPQAKQTRGTDSQGGRDAVRWSAPRHASAPRPCQPQVPPAACSTRSVTCAAAASALRRPSRVERRSINRARPAPGSDAGAPGGQPVAGGPTRPDLRRTPAAPRVPRAPLLTTTHVPGARSRERSRSSRISFAGCGWRRRCQSSNARWPHDVERLACVGRSEPLCDARRSRTQFRSGGGRLRASRSRPRSAPTGSQRGLRALISHAVRCLLLQPTPALLATAAWPAQALHSAVNWRSSGGLVKLGSPARHAGSPVGNRPLQFRPAAQLIAAAGGSGGVGGAATRPAFLPLIPVRRAHPELAAPGRTLGGPDAEPPQARFHLRQMSWARPGCAGAPDGAGLRGGAIQPDAGGFEQHPAFFGRRERAASTKPAR
jgi:hypothetical protein